MHVKDDLLDSLHEGRAAGQVQVTEVGGIEPSIKHPAFSLRLSVNGPLQQPVKLGRLRTEAPDLPQPRPEAVP